MRGKIADVLRRVLCSIYRSWCSATGTSVCRSTHLVDSTLPLNAFSVVCAQAINVSKEKHSEKSAHQHELSATATMIQTRRRLECF